MKILEDIFKEFGIISSAKRNKQGELIIEDIDFQEVIDHPVKQAECEITFDEVEQIN